MDNANMISKDGIKYNVIKSRGIGYENETRDCFVRAVQAVTGVPYSDAHTYVSRVYGRKERKGTYKVQETTIEIAAKCETIFGYRVFEKKIPTRRTIRRSRRFFQYVQAVVYPTLSQMIFSMREGRFIVCSSNHAWAVIDGVVHDNGLTRKGTRVTEVYEFIPSSKCEAMLVGQEKL